MDSDLRWMPDQTNALPYLQQYLDALPSRKYIGKDYQMVTTVSLRLNRSSTQLQCHRSRGHVARPRMAHTTDQTDGSSILQHAARASSSGNRTAGVPQGTHRADNLSILIDSAAAVKILRWVWNHDVLFDRPNRGSRNTASFKTFCMSSSCGQQRRQKLYL